MTEPMFPILGDPIVKAIPWAAITPHEAQAMKNHSQTLNRLAQRGGLGVYEAYWVMTGQGLRWGKLTPVLMAAYRQALMRLLHDFEKKRAEPVGGA
ncbi:hypothetical protein CN213_15885 [Sinorhizobium meliloti]|uniref:hypothetical protein n=1 Tax=Rhizobium meliloti TaxID=382 RepID=UPI000FD76C33|nr:hypothetical protein [Sinorhizobium meliloti]RVH56226.1 hypothetical protein CN213_15885 [Sinorhizobium meliloti]